MSKSVRTRAHDAVVAVLVSARLEAGLTQRDVADRLPRWLGWLHTTVAKVETRRRAISFVEVREYAAVLAIDVATVDKRASDLAAARGGAAKGKTRKPPAVRP